MGLKIDTAVYSHIGRRKNNEDNFFLDGLYMERDQMNKGGQYHAVKKGDEQIYAVCDGMGGAEFGEEASLRAVQRLKEYKEKCRQPDNTGNLNQMIDEASRWIDDISLAKGMESGSSGSTIAMLIMKDWYFRTVNVGDSRVYRLRGGLLERMTKDDSEVQQMVDRGEITLDQAWQHPRKNVITRHLGMPMEGEALMPSVSMRLDLNQGDRFLICSDGLSDSLHDSVIRRILTEQHTPQATAAQLVRTALSEADNMGVASDNITVIVLDVLEAGGQDADVKRIRKLSAARAGLAAASVLLAGGIGYEVFQLIQFLNSSY
ncbi:MAG: serine/threonine-protein phosphatase [Clostridia bacterium]|nr:serine/threonine-protein phosphatase [Clostridia bacterium]